MLYLKDRRRMYGVYVCVFTSDLDSMKVGMSTQVQKRVKKLVTAWGGLDNKSFYVEVPSHGHMVYLEKTLKQLLKGHEKKRGLTGTVDGCTEFFDASLYEYVRVFLLNMVLDRASPTKLDLQFLPVFNEAAWTSANIDEATLATQLRNMGTALRQLRLAARMTLEDVCSAVGMSRATLHKIETGNPKVKIIMLLKITTFFNCNNWLDTLAEATSELSNTYYMQGHSVRVKSAELSTGSHKGH